MEFYAVLALVVVAAIASGYAWINWRSENETRQKAHDEQEKAKSFRHEEPSWHGPELIKNVGLMKWLCLAFAAVAIGLVVARMMGGI